MGEKGRTYPQALVPTGASFMFSLTSFPLTTPHMHRTNTQYTPTFLHTYTTHTTYTPTHIPTHISTQYTHTYTKLYTHIIHIHPYIGTHLQYTHTKNTHPYTYTHTHTHIENTHPHVYNTYLHRNNIHTYNIHTHTQHTYIYMYTHTIYTHKPHTYTHIRTQIDMQSTHNIYKHTDTHTHRSWSTRENLKLGTWKRKLSPWTWKHNRHAAHQLRSDCNPSVLLGHSHPWQHGVQAPWIAWKKWIIYYCVPNSKRVRGTEWTVKQIFANWRAFETFQAWVKTDAPGSVYVPLGVGKSDHGGCRPRVSL